MEPGRHYSKIIKTNIEVVAVFARTVTIRAEGSGLKAGEIVTHKAWPKDDIEPARPVDQWGMNAPE